MASVLVVAAMSAGGLAPHIEAVARHLLGEPNRALSSRTQWRYGSRGSLRVNVGGDDCGTWWDYEHECGGGVIDLIHRETGLTDGAAVEWLQSELGIRFGDDKRTGTDNGGDFNGLCETCGKRVLGRREGARYCSQACRSKATRSRNGYNGQNQGDSRSGADHRRIVATYDYRDESGELLFQVCRLEPKDFRQRRPDGSGGWSWSVKGVRQVPYRLPELLERPEDAPVFVVEGEKDCIRLAKLGLVATCNAGGAGKWRDELSGYLRGAIVHILPDNDDTGRDHARKVATSLHGIAAEVRIVELPDLPPKGDVSDWLAGGGTVERLQALCEAAPLWEPDQAEDDPVFVPQDIEDLDQGDIPPRAWLLGTILCRRFLTVLAASGGSGKTTLLLAWALSLAVGRALVGDYVHRRARVLVLTFEDDIDEYRRRLRAARMHHGISNVGHGWCHIVPLAGIGVTLARAAKDGTLTETDAGQRIVALIRRLRADVVMFDPFIKLSEGNENDNRASDFIARILVRIAIEADVAVLVAHHFRKGAAEAGDIDAARGARAIIDASRLALTLVPMSADEAQTLGVADEERLRLVRLDDGKANLVQAAEKARWFRLASVAIGNSTDDYPHGDNVQTVERWQPPDMWRDLSPSLCCRIIDEIDAGMEDGERYSGSPAAKARGAWQVVLEHAETLTEKQARKVIATWLKTGVLEEREYVSEARREPCKGLFANPAKRPGVCPNG